MNTPSYLSGIIQVKAYRTLQMFVQLVLQDFSLNPTQWSILGLLYKEEQGLKSARIAKILGVEAPLITMMTGPLIQRGYIQKIPHKTDSRAKLLLLSEQGRAYVAQVEQVMHAKLMKLLQGVTQQDLDAYRRVLEVITVNGAEQIANLLSDSNTVQKGVGDTH